MNILILSGSQLSEQMNIWCFEGVTTSDEQCRERALRFIPAQYFHSVWLSDNNFNLHITSAAA